MISALIIRKPTNLEHHRVLQAQNMAPPSADAHYLSLITKAHDEHYSCYDTLRKSLDELGIRVEETSRGAEWPQCHFDFIIALGGDGTLITSSYGIQDDTPLIGIKSSSASVGYLCAGEESSVPQVLRHFVEGRLPFVRRHRLRAQIHRAEGAVEISPFAALNDFLFAASSPAATTRYRIASMDRIESHKSSGIWISTATGSTAAIGAAGGTPMLADDQHLQFLVRELYHRREEGLQIVQGFSDPDNDTFWIENLCPSAILALDGEKWVMKVHFGDRIHSTLGSPVRVAVRPDP